MKASKRIGERDLLSAMTALDASIPVQTPPREALDSPFNVRTRLNAKLAAPLERAHIRNEKDVLRLLDEFRAKRQEHIVCLSVGGGDKLIAKRVVTIGTLDAALAHPREIFADPLADRAAYIIIAHNHPSGEAHPSNKDIEMTQQIAAAGQILGVPLRDHFIVTARGYFSFRQKGFL